MKKHLRLIGDDNVFPYCCNFDLCNTDMCKSMNLPKGHSLCTTTIEHKQREIQKLQNPRPQNGDVEIVQAIPNSNSNQVRMNQKPIVIGVEIPVLTL